MPKKRAAQQAVDDFDLINLIRKGVFLKASAFVGVLHQEPRYRIIEKMF